MCAFIVSSICSLSLVVPLLFSDVLFCRPVVNQKHELKTCGNGPSLMTMFDDDKNMQTLINDVDVSSRCINLLSSVDTVMQCREDWSSASVVSHTIVTDPTIRQPGFDLPRHTWSLMNRFRTGQDPCRANLHKLGRAQPPSCDCGQ